MATAAFSPCRLCSWLTFVSIGVNYVFLGHWWVTAALAGGVM